MKQRISGKTDFLYQLEDLGRAIFFARKERGLTQEALAHAAGIDRAHMGKIERGERNVTYLRIIFIAEALGMRPWELIRRGDAYDPNKGD